MTGQEAACVQNCANVCMGTNSVRKGFCSHYPFSHFFLPLLAILFFVLRHVSRADDNGVFGHVVR